MCFHQVLDTFKVAAELGPESLSAYVISMATNASDVLAVELLKREASLVVSTLRACRRFKYQDMKIKQGNLL